MYNEFAKSYFNEEFENNFAKLLNESFKTISTPKEYILSRTPAYISYEVINNLIKYLLYPGIDNTSTETPMLDSITPEEAKKTLDFMMQNSDEIVGKYGHDILKDFLDKYNDFVEENKKQFSCYSYVFAVYILMITHKLLLGAVVHETKTVKI